ncbi:ABC transporter G family member 6 [Selaginella moellendorffii]|nr:ABC transporter G family member 6 [Selaginella moellendorffii]|eukprot:XP_002971450.2 ABC transporter G family member 6 [Selaginella moellendorffii]
MDRDHHPSRDFQHEEAPFFGSSEMEVTESNPTPISGAEVFVELASRRSASEIEGKENGIASSAQSSSERTHTTPVQGKIAISKPARLGELLNKLRKLQQEEEESLDKEKENENARGIITGSVPRIASAHQVVDLDGLWNSIDKSKPLILLQFSDLTYTVYEKRRSRWPFRTTKSSSSAIPEDNQARNLLENVSGEAREGEILAVMGPSGSGKSTLIDALALRIAKGSLKGSITLNGEEVGTRLLRSISAYVMQDDLLFPMLTVQETLMFSANVRLPQTHSRQKKVERVKMLLEQLGLQRVANTMIGDEGRRGVSGGERRRVSIGIDIIHDPLLLFLDEPTSGLDSTSAYMVVRTLQKIAQTGSVVILSIHQPSYRIMGLVDRLIFLAHGQTVYNGPPSELGSYFTAYGRSVPEHENSTEFALDLIQELHSSPGGIKPLVEFSKLWTSKELRPEEMLLSAPAVDVKTAISVSISRGKLVAARAQAHDCGDRCNGAKVARFANPCWVEMLVIIKRSLINIRRTPELFLMRLGTVILTAGLLATIFWNLDHSPKGVQERLGFLAFAISTTFYTCADALPVFLQERYIFMRETAHSAYRKSSYVLANAIIYVPFLGLLSIAFAATIWWTVGLSGGAPGFLFMFLILWASFWAGNSFVTFLSAVIPNVMLGYTVVVALLAYFLLLSGFFISRERIPRYWIWFHYLSIIKYPYEAVLINEFSRDGACFETGKQILYGTPLQDVNETAVKMMLAIVRSALQGTSYGDIDEDTCVMNGSDVLHRFYITQLGRWTCLGVTIGFGVLFRFLFYVALRRTGATKRQ